MLGVLVTAKSNDYSYYLVLNKCFRCFTINESSIKYAQHIILLFSQNVLLDILLLMNQGQNMLKI